MSELTLKAIEQLLDHKLESQTKELKIHAEDLQAELARITRAGFARTEERFDEIEKRLDVSAEIRIFQQKFKNLEEALHITL